MLSKCSEALGSAASRVEQIKNGFKWNCFFAMLLTRAAVGVQQEVGLQLFGLRLYLMTKQLTKVQSPCSSALPVQGATDRDLHLLLGAIKCPSIGIRIGGPSQEFQCW